MLTVKPYAIGFFILNNQLYLAYCLIWQTVSSRHFNL